jgi:hypothetical protein
MSNRERRLEAAKRKFNERDEERKFSNRSEDVRFFEPEPTLEIMDFRTKETPSMYETIRAIMDGTQTPPASESGRFRTYN